MKRGGSSRGLAQYIWIAVVLLATWEAVFAAGAAPVKVVPGEAECKAFASDLLNALNEKRYDELFQMVDVDAMVNRAFEGVPDAETMKARDRRELRDSLLPEFKAAFSREAEYEFTRYQSDGDARVLVRVVLANGDFDYMTFTVAPVRTQLRVVDFSTFTRGETVSSALRRNLLPLLAEQNKSIFKKLTGEQSDDVKYVKESLAFSTLHRERKYAEALTAYEKLPPSLQNKKSVQVSRLIAIVAVSPKEFPAAVASFSKMFPGDPSIAYYSYYAHLGAKQYEAMLGDIDAMDKELGPDRFFYAMRARCYGLMKNEAMALQMAKAGLSSPRRGDFIGFYYLSLLLQMRRFEDAVGYLNELERDTGKEMYSIIRKIPAYAQFCRSPEFTRWMGSASKLAVDPAIKPVLETATAGAHPTSATYSPSIPAPEPPKTPEPAYKLGGILYSKKSPAAIINGKTLYVGDKIKEAKVIKIEQTSVTIEIDGKTEELRLK